MKVAFLVLCGGKGTRIKSKLKGKPKILAEIGNKTGLDYILEWISLYKGEKNIYFCTGYLGDQVSKYIENKRLDNVGIIKEDIQKGTLATINNGLTNVENEHFVIINGDTLVEINPNEVVERAASIGSRIMLTVKRDKEKQYSISEDKLQKYNLTESGESYKSTGILWVTKQKWNELEDKIKEISTQYKDAGIDNLLQETEDIDVLQLEDNCIIYDYGTAETYKSRDSCFQLIMDKLKRS